MFIVPNVKQILKETFFYISERAEHRHYLLVIVYVDLHFAYKVNSAGIFISAGKQPVD